MYAYCGAKVSSSMFLWKLWLNQWVCRILAHFLSFSSGSCAPIVGEIWLAVTPVPPIHRHTVGPGDVTRQNNEVRYGLRPAAVRERPCVFWHSPRCHAQSSLTGILVMKTTTTRQSQLFIKEMWHKETIQHQVLMICLQMVSSHARGDKNKTVSFEKV